jgi:integrase/recombinase XerC
MHVTVETAKSALVRKISVTRQVLETLVAYREAFGLQVLPGPADTTPLLLSPRMQHDATTLALGCSWPLRRDRVRSRYTSSSEAR